MHLNNLVDEIRDGFANLSAGKRGRLSSLPKDFPAWVYASPATWGVAIAARAGLLISERFAGARLYSEAVEHGTELRLECVGGERRNEFAVVCAQFLEPGENGEERARVQADPTDWWRRWRELLGNAIRQKLPYSVLGELLAYERLFVSGENPNWVGPAKHSHDIEADAASYEIKSTISKYSSTFHVAGQFQLQETAGNKLWVVYQRFEPSPSGESINAVVARLKTLGHEMASVEQKLSRLGFELGSSDRTIKYQLLQSTKYAVDSDFPRITQAAFVGGGVPKGVVSVEYDVELSGVAGVPF